MSHPYAPLIITDLALAAVALLVFIGLCIRRDRRERDQHRWDTSTRDLPTDQQIRDFLDQEQQ